MSGENEGLVAQQPGLSPARFREATEVASVCREIVEKTAVQIGDKRYVIVEGWTSIAVAHGCIATIKEGSVQEVHRDGKLIGVKAVAEIHRQGDGAVLSSAEGFVGDDEIVWFGSHGVAVERWNKFKRQTEMTVIPKREDFAIRSMAQTRAISRVCRTAFAHVVVLMKANLSTVPYEEMPDPGREEEGAPTGDKKPEQTPGAGGGNATPPTAEKKPEAPPAGKADQAPAKPKEVQVPRDPSVALEAQFKDGKWKDVRIHFGTNGPKDGKQGIRLADLQPNQLSWYCFTWAGKGARANMPTDDDKILRAACNAAILELGLKEPSK